MPRLVPIAKSRIFERSKRLQDDAIDATRIALEVLKESADGFPPLKGVASGVLAVWNVHERVKRSKKDARKLATHARDILYELHDAIHDPLDIPPPLLKDLQKFEALLVEIQQWMDELANRKPLAHIVHLNKTERRVEEFHTKLNGILELVQAKSIIRVDRRTHRAERMMLRLGEEVGSLKGHVLVIEKKKLIDRVHVPLFFFAPRFTMIYDSGQDRGWTAESPIARL